MSTDEIMTTDKLIAGMKDLQAQGFDMLAALTAVDQPEAYQMVYVVMKSENGETKTILVNVTKAAPRVPTLVKLWPAANVQEREVYDMFGIEFDGHPNLKRILTEEGFTDFPLRKSYKLSTPVDRQSADVLLHDQQVGRLSQKMRHV